MEATHADRPIPLVSFVARQRDLRELVGENLAGALQLQFADVLTHWEARFHVITLEDRNLPAIAEKRVLKPVSEAARQVLQRAFEEFLSVRREVLDTLLTSSADRELFRQVYPFSPALRTGAHCRLLGAAARAYRFEADAAGSGGSPRRPGIGSDHSGGRSL